VLHFQGSTNWAINAQYLTKIQEVRCLSACPQIVSSAESSHLEEPVYVLSEETDETGDLPRNVYPSSREEAHVLMMELMGYDIEEVIKVTLTRVMRTA